MNDFSELEAELKQLRPAAPSVGLMSRIERALLEEPAGIRTAAVLPRRSKFQMNLFGLGLGLAAAAAFLMLARVNVDRPAQKKPAVAAAKPTVAPQTPAIAGKNFVPDGLTRVVYNRSNEGLVYPVNSDRPVRRVRSHSRETLQWKDAGSGASLRVSYPTEEIELIPVSGQ